MKPTYNKYISISKFLIKINILFLINYFAKHILFLLLERSRSVHIFIVSCSYCLLLLLFSYFTILYFFIPYRQKILFKYFIMFSLVMNIEENFFFKNVSGEIKQNVNDRKRKERSTERKRQRERERETAGEEIYIIEIVTQKTMQTVLH